MRCPVCGPSGAGKSTLIERLKADNPDDFGFSVRCGCGGWRRVGLSSVLAGVFRVHAGLSVYACVSTCVALVVVHAVTATRPDGPERVKWTGFTTTFGSWTRCRRRFTAASFWRAPGGEVVARVSGQRDWLDTLAFSVSVARCRCLRPGSVHGNLYGTSKDAVNRVRKANKICILDIDVQGPHRRHNNCRGILFCCVCCVRLAPAASRGSAPRLSLAFTC